MWVLYALTRLFVSWFVLVAKYVVQLHGKQMKPDLNPLQLTLSFKMVVYGHCHWASRAVKSGGLWTLSSSHPFGKNMVAYGHCLRANRSVKSGDLWFMGTVLESPVPSKVMAYGHSSSHPFRRKWWFMDTLRVTLSFKGGGLWTLFSSYRFGQTCWFMDQVFEPPVPSQVVVYGHSTSHPFLLKWWLMDGLHSCDQVSPSQVTGRPNLVHAVVSGNR